MHYYQFNIGDYRRDTQHLSLLEHGIYRLLLDQYYLTEKPLDANALRLVCVRDASDVAIAMRLLSEFFCEIEPGQFIHAGCDKVISKFKEKSLKASTSAKTRWDANAMRTHSEGNANHKPLTNNHKPITNIKPKATATLLPEWLDENVWSDFKSHRIASKSKMTAKAEALAIGELSKLKAQGHDPTEVIKQSIMRGWKGLFALNGHDNTKGKTRHEQHSDFVAELTGRNKRKPVDDPTVIHGTAERLD